MAMPFRRKYGYSKPALLTVNHCETTSFTSAASVTNQRTVFVGADAPANRNQDIPAGAILKEVDIKYWSIDGTPPNGKHECLMVFQPGATTYSDPIAAWLNETDPLSEEAIQIRQNKMGLYQRKQIISGISGPLTWHCRWRGNKMIRDGDDVVVAIKDLVITNWDGYCIAKYIN